MSRFLKQSTASQSRALGPFVDDTDFKTAETGLTIANTDIKLVANGAASADKNSGGGTHRINGVYGVTFDATDTATVGELFVSVKVAGALPVFAQFTVVEEAVYAAFYDASATGFVSDTSRASQTSVDTIDDFLDTEIAAIKAKTDNLPSDPADASDVAALITAVDDLVDTEVAAIKTVVDAVKVKTDSLTFTVAGVVDANIQRVNDVTIVGDGSGTPFNV